MSFVKRFVKDEEGQDLVEYALLLGFVAIAALAAVTFLGTSVSSYFTSVGGKLPAS